MLLLRRLAPKLITASALSWTLLALAGSANAHAASYVPGQVLVGYTGQPASTTDADLNRKSGISPSPVPSPSPGTHVLNVPSGVSVPQAAAWVRKQPGVAYAVPNFIAHTAGSFFPNDRGHNGRAGGWERYQWNFLPGAGVNAPEAWGNLIAEHRPGGRGVVVAILDTGVAYRRWHQFRRSPDFAGTHFVHPYDFVAHNRFPVDREGHGTFVTGTVAEATNNKLGITGLAYGASIMPVRILAADGTGDAATISRGIRYAANHGARVINLSLEFSLDVGPGDIPDILSAIRYARQRGTLVVASAGNEGASQVAYP